MPAKRSTPTGYQHAHELRQATTPCEARLWAYLRRQRMQGVIFRRQHALGPYVVDFCSPARRLIIEVDGGQHIEQADYDRDRTAFLEEMGYRVLRFWNHEVSDDIESVLLRIQQALEHK